MKEIEHVAEDLFNKLRSVYPTLQIGDSSAMKTLEPEQARFVINDGTIEKIGELLKANPLGLLQYRDELSGFIKGLNKEHVTVLAHDWGAVYASQYLKKNDLVDRLVLFDIGSFGDEKRPTINVKYTFALAVAWTLPEFLGDKLALYTADKILKIEDVDPNKTIADLRSDPRMTYPYWHLWNSVLTKNTTKATEIKDYGTPFLFMYGKDKKVWFHAKSWEKELQEQNKGQVEVVPGGHWFMQSSPDLVNKKIYNWLSSH